MKRFLLLAALVLATALPARADSLLVESEANLFQPVRPKLGDLVTIYIVDQVTSSQTVQQNNTLADTTLGPTGGGILAAVPVFEITTGGDHKRNQSSTSTVSFVDTVTARVVGVEPNGLLKLEASRVVLMDGRERRVAFKGTVRPQDVQADNRIPSAVIADAVLEVEGMSASPVQGGFLSWILGIFR